MGAFYQAKIGGHTKATVDVPEDFLLKVVLLNDMYVDQQMQALDQLDQALQKNQTFFFAQPELNELNQRYMQTTDQLRDALYKNPGMYKQIAPMIRKLGTSYMQTLNSDRYKDMINEYNLFKEWSQQIDQLPVKHPDKYRQDDVTLTKMYNLKLSELYYKANGGPNSNQRNVRFIQDMDVPEYIDPTEWIKTIAADGFKANTKDGSSITVQQDKFGRWFIIKRGKVEYVSEDRVKNYVQNALLENDKFTSYYYNKAYMGAFVNYVSKQESLGRTDYANIMNEARQYAAAKGKDYLLQVTENVSENAKLYWAYTKEEMDDLRMVKDSFYEDLLKSVVAGGAGASGSLTSQTSATYGATGADYAYVTTGETDVRPFDSDDWDPNKIINIVKNKQVFNTPESFFNRYFSDTSSKFNLDFVDKFYDQDSNGNLVLNINKVMQSDIDPNKKLKILNDYSTYEFTDSFINNSLGYLKQSLTGKNVWFAGELIDKLDDREAAIVLNLWKKYRVDGISIDQLKNDPSVRGKSGKWVEKVLKKTDEAFNDYFNTYKKTFTVTVPTINTGALWKADDQYRTWLSSKFKQNADNLVFINQQGNPLKIATNSVMTYERNDNGKLITEIKSPTEEGILNYIIKNFDVDKIQRYVTPTSMYMTKLGSSDGKATQVVGFRINYDKLIEDGYDVVINGKHKVKAGPTSNSLIMVADMSNNGVVQQSAQFILANKQRIQDQSGNTLALAAKFANGGYDPIYDVEKISTLALATTNTADNPFYFAFRSPINKDDISFTKAYWDNGKLILGYRYFIYNVDSTGNAYVQEQTGQREYIGTPIRSVNKNGVIEGYTLQGKEAESFYEDMAAITGTLPFVPKVYPNTGLPEFDASTTWNAYQTAATAGANPKMTVNTKSKTKRSYRTRVASDSTTVQ